LIHYNSQAVVARALYSASKEDLETIDCFFDFHKIKEEPRKIQYHVVDCLVLGQDTQLESLNALFEP